MKLTALYFLSAAITAVFVSPLAAQSPGPGPAPAPVPAQAPPQGIPGAPPPAEQDYPPLEKVTEGYEKVISTADGAKSFYTLWTRQKDQQVLAELPQAFAQQKHFLALTVSSGESYAGLQAGDLYFYWKQYGKRLAMVVPNLDTRSTGDQESQNSVKRLFTDQVLLDLPIVAWVPRGGPVIDIDELCVGMAGKFFTGHAAGLNRNIYSIRTAKAFPQNVELAFEAAVGDGKLKSFHYSFSLMPDNTGYQPRAADDRVGYFTTYFNDFGKFEPDKTRVRYINRWHLEKADPSLKLSPPKTPIIFYVEHTTPIRYRRWVKEGVLMWNRAYEKVGLVNALEVRFQDAATGENMDKNPEDVRYNFIRWLSNGAGTAIGPSRVHPLTGQILDADIVLTDGWIRHWWTNYNEVIPQIAMESMTPETMQWLHQNPQWDPRVRLAAPERRQEMIDSRSREPLPALGGHPLAFAGKGMLGENDFDGLVGRHTQQNGYCNCANAKTLGLGHLAMQMEILAAEGFTPQPNQQLLDGIPEDFLGPLLMDLTVHEVGHTLGLRHNFKASSIYSYGEINGDQVRGKKAFAGSVMDYIPINIVVGKDAPKGDIGMISVGPYDEWAIEYGYSFEKDLKPILAKTADPLLTYATDEDTWGPDPLARRYDFAKDPLAYAENQIRLAKEHRGKLLDKFVKDGDSWAKARRGYQLTLSSQVNAVMMMANWVGGSHINRHHKGDPNGRAPVEVVSVEQQRAALKFVMANAFADEAFGLTPELMAHLTVEKWHDMENMFDEPAWPVHDKILGIQATALTAVMNPTTLARVYDNELRTPADKDALTLPELLDSLRDGIWDELDKVDANRQYTARQPLISSLQRNLQREHLDRLMDLANNKLSGPAAKPIGDLAMAQLDGLKGKFNNVAGLPNVDPYSRAHLREAINRVTKLQESRYLLTK
jgi:hypothetical protein